MAGNISGSGNGDKLSAIFLLATLKHKRAGQEFSHTETLAEVVIECLNQYDVSSEMIRLVEHDIPAGVHYHVVDSTWTANA